jgi:tetratricopeptide (TPR) repeat protein
MNEDNLLGDGFGEPPVGPEAATNTPNHDRPQLDFFVSRRGASARVAQEVADVLTAAGYSLLVQDHDIPHGANFILAMHDALKRCRHFIALLNRDYDSTPFTTAEWTNFYAIAAQSGGERRFVVLRIEDCDPQGLFSAVVFGDLVGIDNPQERRNRILAAAEGRAGETRRRPKLFENVPPPDLNFTGREAPLAKLFDILDDGIQPAANKIAAVHGLGGVGKTSIVAEYVHRRAEAYAGVWWAPAQERTLLIASLAALAGRLDAKLAAESNQERAARAALAHIAGRAELPFLLVYDNVDSPDTVRELLPVSGAHLLLSTRWADWGGQATEVRLEALSPEAAATFLQKRAMREDLDGAARLAGALGFLPLALDHAGAFCKLTRTSFAGYVERIDSRITRAPKGANYPASVAATFGLAIEKVAAECPAAERLLAFCAYLAPELIPLDLIDKEIPDEEQRAEAMMALSAVSLIEHPNFEGEQPVVSVHRLVQAAMRTRLAERGETQDTLARVIQGLVDQFPTGHFRHAASMSRRARLLPHVLAIRECLQTSGLESPAAGRLFSIFGRYLRTRGDFGAAELLMRDAVAANERTFGQYHAHVAVALHDLALLHLNSGRYEEAKALIPRAIEVGERTLDRKAADAVTQLNSLANLLHHVGRKAEAEALYREAIDIMDASDQRECTDMANLLNNLGNFLRSVGRHREAETYYQRAITIGTVVDGRHHPNVARHVHNLANMLRTEGRYAEAEPLYREAIADLSNGLGSEFPITARAQRNLAALLMLTDRPEEALRYAEPAFRVHSKSGAEPGWAKDSARTYVQVLEALGRNDEALSVRKQFGLEKMAVRSAR